MAGAPDPWPGTEGGAYSPNWGGDIRLYVWAGILAGSTMKWGTSPTDRLDSGNVWSSGGVARLAPPAPTGRLWIDVSCDVRTVETSIGGTRATGAIAQSEAGTCTITLADPDRVYDPTNPTSPYQYGGQTRLSPGANLVVFAEYWDGTGISQYRLFTGTVDTWGEEWELRPGQRQATIVASDAVKDLVNRDYGQQPAVGAGETVDARINRILTYYSWTGPKHLDVSVITEQATTLAQSAWELIGRATEDELGFSYIDQTGTLQFRNRGTWATTPDPVLVIGCDAVDMMTGAVNRAASLDITNAAYGSPTGGVTQVARNETSIARYELRSYKRTDLGLQTNAQALEWAQYLVTLRANPRPQLDSVTVIPAFDPTVWPDLLGLELVTDRVMVTWTTPDMAEPTEVTGRVLAIGHTISHARWETNLSLIFAEFILSVMHWGVHPKDKLTVGNTYR
jgi:hypothetical protein